MINHTISFKAITISNKMMPINLEEKSKQLKRIIVIRTVVSELSETAGKKS